MPDGSLRIKTRLDNSNIDKGVVELENKMKKVQSDIAKNNIEQKGLELEIQNYEQLTQKADEYKNKIKKLEQAKLDTKKIPKQELLMNNEEYVEIQNKIQKIKNDYLKAIEDIENKYKSKKTINAKTQLATDKYMPQLHELTKQRDSISSNVLSQDSKEINTQISEIKRKYAEIAIEIDKQSPKIERVHEKLNKVKQKQTENNSKMQEYRRRVEEARKKLEEAKNEQAGLSLNTDGMGKSLNKGITKILRYGMALLSIRSIYGVLSNAMNMWLNGNSKGAKQLKSDIDYMKISIGRALSPVLKYIVNLLYQAIGLAGALIKAFTGIDIFAGSVADYMSSTTSSANKTNKELKKQLVSFDKINKLGDNSSETTGSGSSGGGVVAPSQDLSQIMNKYTEFAEKVKKIFDEVKDIIPIIGAGILAWKLSDLFFGQLNGINSLQAKVGITLVVAGLYLLYNGVTRILDGDLSLESILMALGGGAMTTVGIATLLRMLKNGQMFSWGKALKIGFGITLAIVGVMAEYNAVKKMLSGDISLGTILQATGSAFLVGLGVWLTTGSMPAGLIATAGVLAFNIGIEIGVAIGNFIHKTEEVDVKASDLTNTIKELNEELDNNRKSYENAIKSIEDTCKAQIAEADYAKRIARELDGLVTSNGEVIKGNEKRVDFILGELSNALGIELQRNGNLITQNGKVVDSYNELQSSIFETIEAKKREAEQFAIMEMYKESIKEQIQAEKDLQKAREVAGKAYEEYTDLMSKGYSDWTLTHDKNCKQILQNMADTGDALKKTQEAYDKTTNNVSYYSQKMTDNVIKDTGIITNEMIKQSQVSSKTLQEMVKNNYESWEKNYNNLNTASKSAMLAQSTTLATWSPVIEQKWRDMANTSAQDFLNGISKVDVETRAKILSTITTTNNLTPELERAWINLATESKNEYSNALSKVEPETRTKIRSIIEAVGETQGEVSSAFLTMGQNSCTNYGSANFRGAGYNATNQLKEGISEGNWQVQNEARSVATNASDTARNNMNGYRAGSFLVSGIAQGISQNRNVMSSALKGIANFAVNSFNVAMGIHSPSRVMAQQAKFIPLGIAEGIDSTQDKAIGSMKDLVYGMQESVDELDYSNMSKIPKLPRNAVTFVPKQSISTNEVQRSIIGQDNDLLNKLLSIIQTPQKSKTPVTIQLTLDGEELIKKTIELNDNYNLVTNGGGF